MTELRQRLNEVGVKELTLTPKTRKPSDLEVMAMIENGTFDPVKYNKGEEIVVGYDVTVKNFSGDTVGMGLTCEQAKTAFQSEEDIIALAKNLIQ